MNGNTMITQAPPPHGNSLSQWNSSELGDSTSTQGALTVICRANTVDMYERKKNVGPRYPGGVTTESLRVSHKDIVIGPKNCIASNGAEFIQGFSSLSGLSFGDASSVEELEENYWCIGVSRSDHDTVPDASTNTVVNKQGWATLVGGITTITIKGDWRRKPISAGKDLFWRFPTVEEAKAFTRTMSTTHKPLDKLTVIVEPFDWSYIQYLLRNIMKIILRSGNDIGISNRLGFNYDQSHYERAASDSSGPIRVARAFGEHSLTTVCIGVEVLATRGLIEVLTPAKKQRKSAQLKLLRSSCTFIKGSLGMALAFFDTLTENDIGVGSDAEFKVFTDAQTSSGALKKFLPMFTLKEVRRSGIKAASDAIRELDNVSSAFKIMLKRRRDDVSKMPQGSDDEKADHARATKGIVFAKSIVDALIEARSFFLSYKTYAEALNVSDTDVTTSTNTEFNEEFQQPFTWFSMGHDLIKQIKSGQVEATTSTAESDAALVKHKMGKINDTLFVANYLGLTRGGRGERQMVTHDILNATNIAFADEATAAKYHTGHSLGSQLGVIATKTHLSMLREYKRLSEEHLIKASQELTTLSGNLESRKIGTAMSYAAPDAMDTKVDILIRRGRGQ